MNERIRELALEARIAYYSKNGSYEGSDDGLSVIPSTQSLEKFAELLIRECLDIIRCDAKNFRGCDIKTDLVVVEEYNKTFKYIKEHFGVEE